MQKFLAVLLVLAVLGAGIGYLLLQQRHFRAVEGLKVEHEAALQADREAAATIARELATDLVAVLARAAAEDLARNDEATLEGRLAEAVQSHRLAGALAVAPDGRVIATTDLHYRGRVLDDPATLRAAQADAVTVVEERPAPGQVEVVAPLVAAGQRLGCLRAIVDLGELAG